MGKATSDFDRLVKKIGCCANVTKFIMGVLFIILCILGVAIVCVCAVGLTKSEWLGDLAIKDFHGLMVFGLILGLFLAAVSILGAIGYFRLNRVLLVIVIIVIILLALLQIICGAAGLATKDKYEDFIQTAWDSMDEADRKYFEEDLKCCGGANSTDRPAAPECLSNSSVVLDSSSAFSDGCVSILAEKAEDLMVSVGVGLLVTTVVEIVIIALSIFVVVRINNARKYSNVPDDNTMDALDS